MSTAAPALLPRPRQIRLDTNRVVPSVEPLYRRDDRISPEGYRLRISADGDVTIESADDAGRFYAQCTLAQLKRLDHDGQVSVGEIEDWPDLAVRGVMLDVSRTKVPRLDTLFSLVDRLASWKCNHLELYMEHTFAYPGHEAVWVGADPYQPAEMAALATYCAEHHVELVANQNCLGHMERWLLHDRYAPLGLTKSVERGPFGLPLAPSTLDPANPGSLALVRQLVDTLGDYIPARRFHVGLDEPWDLPRSRAGEWASWLDRLRRLPETAGRDLLVWGDMPAAHPELLGALGDGVTVCEWGYEANHPFAARCEALAGASLDHWVSPGTSSWLSVVGRATNAIDNCRAAAQAAVASGASGMLVTDWGDMGHLQHLPVSDPGLAAAAAFSWCLSANSGLDTATVASLLDVHCYGDEAGHLGAAVVGLGDAHTHLPLAVPNISALVMHLYFPQLAVGPELYRELSADHLQAVEDHLDEATEAMARSRPTSEHGRLAVDELGGSTELVRLCCADLRARLRAAGTLGSVPYAVRAEMAGRLGQSMETHRQLWPRRNRVGGLQESLSWLEHLRRCYIEGVADEDWAGPVVAAARARQATSA